MSTTETSDLQRKLRQKAIMEAEVEKRQSLPHLYALNLYRWQRQYIESTNKVNLICAANQIGKSSCNVIKWVTWATEPDLWPKLWPKRRPRQFWIFLPSKDLIEQEFRTKWEPEFLPRGKWKDHKQYGWKAETRNRYLWAIHFRTGITCYMKTYEQDRTVLQAGTVDAHFIDEECPYNLVPELLLRLAATEGYFNSVMTPTIGQEEWRRTFMVKGDQELFQGAFKQTVSTYDCMEFEDGTKSGWTEERIKRLEQSLGTQAEIDLRIHGKFVAQDGLKLPSFSTDRNVLRDPPSVPEGWLWFSGVDVGSGGKAHPPAIALVAVRPDFKYARAVRCWRGSPSQIYTATDILNKYIELREGRLMSGEYYDWQSKDFHTISLRAGVAMQPAEKSHDIGYPLMNALFKNQMLDIDDTDENQAFVAEALSLRDKTQKTHAKDDAVDSVRYAISRIQWNFEGVTGEKPRPVVKVQETLEEQRYKGLREAVRPVTDGAIEDEISFWNQLNEW